MAFRHGVYKSEVPTSLLSPAQLNGGLPVIVGTAPVFMADSSCVNKPVLCYTYQEAVEAIGFSRSWEKWTLSEFIYSQFALYGVGPCVLINVFDPGKHKEKMPLQEFAVQEGAINLGQNVFPELEFETDKNYSKNTDYFLEYDELGNLHMTLAGQLANATTIKISLTKAKPENVTAYDIIGGITTAGNATGLELVGEVYPKFGLVPGIIGAPGFSENPTVAAVMRAKASNINGIFTCISVVDVPSSVKKYSDVPSWKNSNNYVSTREIACWPKIKLGDDDYHLSTQLIGLMNSVDFGNDDIPYASPSNHILQMNACINEDGDEINLGLEQANYLNSQGIVTALNFAGGWKAWGNRLGSYPTNTDPKDNFIPVRRMFDYVGNTFILTFWQKLDAPVTVRLIRTIIDSFNMYLNGLTAREVILGGRIEFKESENVLTDLMNGELKFHIYLTPPVPAEVIEGILEFDPDYLETLFEAMR